MQRTDRRVNTAEVCTQSQLQPGTRGLQVQKDAMLAQSNVIVFLQSTARLLLFCWESAGQCLVLDTGGEENKCPLPKTPSSLKFSIDLRHVIMPRRYWPVLKEAGRPISLAEIPRAVCSVLSLWFRLNYLLYSGRAMLCHWLARML